MTCAISQATSAGERSRVSITVTPPALKPLSTRRSEPWRDGCRCATRVQIRQIRHRPPGFSRTSFDPLPAGSRSSDPQGVTCTTRSSVMTRQGEFFTVPVNVTAQVDNPHGVPANTPAQATSVRGRPGLSGCTSDQENSWRTGLVRLDQFAGVSADPADAKICSDRTRAAWS
jgi:hypothetical protein